MNRVGLHLRMQESLVNVAQRAVHLSLPFFQTFITRNVHKKMIWPSQYEITAFREVCAQYFTHLFAHGSFWLNPSHTQKSGAWALRRELRYAKELGFTHFVLHAGCATGAKHRIQGIYALARTINNVLRQVQDIILVLENTAHGNLSVGSDISDFMTLRQYFDYPERVRFCIDTAHAYAFGYSLCSHKDIETFVQFLDDTIGVKNIALIHLNDTCDAHGSRIDRHALLGSGSLDVSCLRQLVMHKHMVHIPIILEPPLVPEAQIMHTFKIVKQWENR